MDTDATAVLVPFVLDGRRLAAKAATVVCHGKYCPPPVCTESSLCHTQALRSSEVAMTYYLKTMRRRLVMQKTC